MIIRKTAEQIKDEILSSLKEEPLSIEQLRKKVESNWSTTSNYLEELKKEGKVKEIISADKAKIFQRILGDTYFDIPITDEERKKFRTLFGMIIQEYKSKGAIPTKTHLSKCAVYVIKNESSGLSELPMVWYLYGLIPQMIADPSQEYKEEIILEHKTKIMNLIKEYISRNGTKGSGQLQREQHEEYGEELYILSDKFFKILSKPEIKNQEVLEILNKLFIVCPIDAEFPEVFDLTEKLFSIIEKLSMIGIQLQNHRKEILLSFDSLWKFIALYKLYKSRTTGKNAINKETLLRFYVGNALEIRKRTLQESISELNSVYLNNLPNFDSGKIKLSNGAQEIRKIMEGWTGED
jgi:hypothetical protein